MEKKYLSLLKFIVVFLIINLCNSCVTHTTDMLEKKKIYTETIIGTAKLQSSNALIFIGKKKSYAITSDNSIDIINIFKKHPNLFGIDINRTTITLNNKQQFLGKLYIKNIKIDFTSKEKKILNKLGFKKNRYNQYLKSYRITGSVVKFEDNRVFTKVKNNKGRKLKITVNPNLKVRVSRVLLTPFTLLEDAVENPVGTAFALPGIAFILPIYIFTDDIL